MNCRTSGLILPVEWGWRSGQTYFNSDARIADEGRARFNLALPCHGLTPFYPRRAAEGHGDGNGNTFCPQGHCQLPFVHGGPRKGTENGNGNTFYPRRGAEGGGERQRQHLLSTEGRGGARRTARTPFFVREGARRGGEENLFLSTEGREGQGREEHLFCPRRGAEGQGEQGNCI